MGIFALHTVAEAKPAVYTLVGIIAHGAGIVDDKVCLLTVAEGVADLFQNAGKLFGVAGVHLTAKGHDGGGQGMSCKLLLLLYILSAFGDKIILTLRFRYRGLLGQIDAVKVNVFVHHKGSYVSFPFFILW